MLKKIVTIFFLFLIISCNYSMFKVIGKSLGNNYLEDIVPVVPLITSKYTSRNTYDTDYGNGTHFIISSTGQLAFQDSDLSWKDLKFEDKYRSEGYYLLENGFITVKVYNDKVSLSDPDNKVLLVENETYVIKFYKNNIWNSVTLSVPILFYSLNNNSLTVSKLYIQNEVNFNLTYVLSVGEGLYRILKLENKLGLDLTKVIRSWEDIKSKDLYYDNVFFNLNRINFRSNRYAFKFSDWNLIEDVGSISEIKNIEVFTDKKTNCLLEFNNFTLGSTYLFYDKTTVSTQIIFNTDDCVVTDSTAAHPPWDSINTSNSSDTLGYSGSYYGAGVRFSASLPRNSTTQDILINNAVLSFRASQTLSTVTINVTIAAHDVNNSATFSNIADYNGRSRTTSVTWNVSGWTKGSWYNSTDISSIVQILANNLTWSTSSYGTFFVEDDGTSSAGAYRAFYDNWAASANATKLYITYTSNYYPTIGTPSYGMDGPCPIEHNAGNDKVYHGKISYNITVLYSDLDGYADMDYMEIAFKQSSTERCRFRYDEDTNTFTEESGSSYWYFYTVNGSATNNSRAIESGNGCNVTWRFYAYLNVTLENDLEVEVYLVDDEVPGRSDNDTYSNAFDVHGLVDVTPYYNTGGIFEINQTAVVNGTKMTGFSSEDTNHTILNLQGIPNGNGTYCFYNFTYTGCDYGTDSITNSDNISFTMNATIWCYFEPSGNVTTGGAISYSISDVFSNAAYIPMIFLIIGIVIGIMVEEGKKVKA